MADVSKKNVSLFKHLLLLILTFGLYRLGWIASTTRFLNQGTLKKRDPFMCAGLSLFVPFYSLYWAYRTGLAVDGLGEKRDGIISVANLAVILCLACPFASDVYIQGKINDLDAETDFSQFHAADLRDSWVGLVKYIVLSVLTLGIYRFVRIYRLTKALNTSNYAETRHETKCAILSAFIPFYSAYWVYKSALIVDSILPNNRITTTVVVLTAFGGSLFAELLLQDRVNFIADAQNG
jgi:ABC-type dipeptide/oligopeptide/nickel transport system permease component